MRILLTNDDGVHAKGLSILHSIAREFSDDIWIVAPQDDQSGASRSLSLDRPLSWRKQDKKVWSVTGTPSDCVIMAARHLVPAPIDLILSGVNNGQNIGDYIHYSGTVAGAMEGTLLGIPSFALSQARDFSDNKSATQWDTSLSHAPTILRRLLSSSIPSGTLMNINFPNCDKDSVKTSIITRQGHFGHALGIEERHTPSGRPYQWLTFSGDSPPIIDGTDISALSTDHISITPIHLDLTDHTHLVSLEGSWSS